MKILITGANGTIGSLLAQHLPHDITSYDLPTHDALNREQLVEAARGHDVIIHLAWNFDRDGFLGESLNPDNVQMTFNIYEAAVLAGVPRVIMASSVHADRFTRRRGQHEPLRPFDLPLPDSPYGASKVHMESLGRYYADSKDLGVICIRFGAVSRDNLPHKKLASEREVWLSHRDCVSLLQHCVEAPSIPYNFTIVYGISANTGTIHDMSNPFGWHPVDDVTRTAPLG